MWHNPLKHKIFRYPKLLTHKSVPEPNLSAKTKNFGQKFVILPPSSPPLLSIKFTAIGNFLKHSTEGFPYEVFRYCDTKHFDGKSLVLPPLLLSLTFFDTRNFLKQRRVPRRDFSALWDKNFSKDNRDTLLHKVQKSVVELMFVKILWKLISKQ